MMSSSNPSSNANVSGGECGKGAGKGGGSGGSIREAGGSFGKMEAARDLIYYLKLQNQQLAKLEKLMSDVISQSKSLIQHQKDAFDRLESHIQDLQSQEAMKDKVDAEG